MATMPKALIEVECKHERECAVHSKFLLDIIRDALSMFKCTQPLEFYSPDHWSHRAQRVIGDRSRLPDEQARTCRKIADLEAQLAEAQAENDKLRQENALLIASKDDEPMDCGFTTT